MIRIKGIDHVVIRVRDADRMIAFYRDVLGCAVERARKKLGLYHLRAGACQIDLVPVDGKLGRKGGRPPARQRRNMDHFCLRVEPFDAAAIAAHLKAHGVAAGAVTRRFGAEGEGPSMYITDPEGNTVELKGPPEAAKPRKRSRRKAAKPPKGT